MSDALRAAGFIPIVVSSGEAAVEAVRDDEAIAVALLDVDPRFGVQDRHVTSRIVEIRDIPIVLLTDHVAADDDASQPTLKESFRPTLAETVTMALEASASQRELAEERDRRRDLEDAYRSFVRSFQGIAFRIALDGTPVFMHGEVEEITGYKEADFVAGRVRWDDLMVGEDVEVMVSERPRLQTIPGYRVDHEHELVRADGSSRWVRERIASVADANGKVRWIQGVISDVTRRRTTEQRLQATVAEKEALVREMNHRVKNNIALLRSLVTLQAARSSDQAGMTDIASRVSAIGLIHEKLQQADVVSDVLIGDYLRDLVATVFEAGGHTDVSVHVSVPDIPVSSKVATSLGLLVNELATNAMKHGFANASQKRFSVELVEDATGDGVVLVVDSGGPPLPDDVDLEHPSTLGLRLVSVLVRQMEGTLEVRRSPSPRFTVRIPRS